MENLFFTFNESNDRNELLATTIYYDNVWKENDDILWKQRITWKRKITQETVDSVNGNSGYAFFLSTNNRLYYGKIKKLVFPSLFDRSIDLDTYLSSNRTAYTFLDEMSDGSFTITLENLTELDYNALGYLFARRNRSKLGNQEFSLLTKWEKSFFPYARPLIAMDTKTFFKNFSINIAFREHLLYDNQLIPSSNNQGKTFGIIVEEDGKNIISLINEKMLEVDRTYFLGETISNEELSDYRPYVYEFIPDELTDERITRMELEKHQLYPIELLSDEQDNRSGISVNETGERFIKGEVLFSASPLDQQRALIHFTAKKNEELDKDLEQIFNTRKTVISNKDEIKNFFEASLSLSDFKSTSIKITIEVYSVGQANWIVIEGDDNASKKFSLTFDIGFKGGKTHKDAIKAARLKTADINLFMLSHWDLDHILGITELSRENFEKPWIVPDPPKKLSLTAKRLAAYLSKKEGIHPLFVSDELNNEKIFNTDYFTLGKGNGYGKSDPYNGKTWATSYTQENNIGLILEIINNQKSLLLPGDCEYIRFPKYFRKSYDMIVVSHHGAKLIDIALPDRPKGNCLAYACVNKNDASYPHSDHEDLLQKKGYTVKSVKNTIAAKIKKSIDLS